MQTALKTKQQECCTQFQITSDLLRNLYKFNLTPVTKLVLLELTTHLNENKNGSVVFPSVGYIAEVLGIGLTAAKKAINDLIKEGIIIKTKRTNVRGNYNKYIFTQKITSVRIDFKAGKNENRYKYTQEDVNGQNLSNLPPRNELLERSESELFMTRTNNKKQINNKEDFKGGNVYSGDDEILSNYAINHGAKNIQAYIRKLKETGSAKKIIADYKKKAIRSVYAFRQTDLLREIREDQKQNRVMPEENTAWLELGKKLGFKRIP